MSLNKSHRTGLLCLLCVLCLAALMFIPAKEARAAGKKITCTLKNGTLTIKGRGSIPSSKKIGKRAKIKKIVIKNGITEIPGKFFMRCKNVREITIPPSVHAIGENAFKGCKKIKKLTVPASFQIIDFADRDAQTPGPFPEKIKKVFLNTKFPALNRPGKENGVSYFNTKYIQVMTKDPAYKSINGIVYTKDGRRIVCIPGECTNVTVADGCEIFDICCYLYSGRNSEDWYPGCRKLKMISFPTSVREIINGTRLPLSSLNESFSYFKNMTFTIRNHNISGQSASILMHVAGISQVAKWFPDKVTQKNGLYLWGNDYVLTYDAAGKELVLPEGIQTIGPGAFSYEERGAMLEKVTFPSSLKTIDEEAFYCCVMLSEIHLPDGLQKIGSYAFYCTSLQENSIPLRFRQNEKKPVWSYSSENKNRCYDADELAFGTKKQRTVQYFSRAKRGKTLALKMNAPGIFSFYSNVPCKVYDAADRELEVERMDMSVLSGNYAVLSEVKEGDTLYLKIPVSYQENNYFIVQDGRICPVNDTEISTAQKDTVLRGGIGTSYRTFSLKKRSKIVLYSAPLRNRKTVKKTRVKYWFEKKSGQNWIPVSNPVTDSRGRGTAGTFGLEKGDYRLSIQLENGIWHAVRLHAEPDKNTAVKKATVRTKAASLVKQTKPGSDSIFTPNDSLNRWYKITLKKSADLQLSVTTPSFTGKVTVSLYRKGTKKPLKTAVINAAAGKNADGCDFTVTRKGTYYIRVNRRNKKTIGSFSVGRTIKYNTV